MQKTSPRIEAYADPDECAALAQRYLQRDIAASIAERGRCVIALAGGSTPKLLYQKLAELPSDAIDWSRVVLIWGDERNVGPNDPQSNYRMVREALLDRLVAQPTIHRIRTGDLPAEEAAKAYSDVLFQLARDGDKLDREMENRFGRASAACGLMPSSLSLRIDVVLLGIGDDAHTASLFPGTDALLISGQSVIANRVPQLETIRVTLSYELFNNALQVYFLVCGASKRPALKHIFGPDRDIAKYPAQGVRPTLGQVTWLVDHAAWPAETT